MGTKIDLSTHVALSGTQKIPVADGSGLPKHILTADIVGDAIANGEVLKAPSQNVVFDALALKANTADLGTMAAEAAADYTPTAGLAAVATSGDAADVDFDDTGLSITAADVQTALEELDAAIPSAPTYGTAAGAGVVAVESGNSVIHQTTFTLTGVVVNITDNGAGGGAGSLKIYDLPVGTFAPVGTTWNITLTAGAGGIEDTATIVFQVNSDGAGSTNEWSVATNDPMVAGILVDRRTSGINTTVLFTSHASEASGSAIISNDIYLDITIPNTLDISANDTITVDGTLIITSVAYGEIA